MLYTLPVDAEELHTLHQRFGLVAYAHYPLAVDTPFLDGNHQRLTSDGRRAEICYVMHRGDPHAGVLLHRKAFYPMDAYRLPTGGIHVGESVLETLAREIEEETSFHLEIPPSASLHPSPQGSAVLLQAFLGTLAYEFQHRSQGSIHRFATYHFLVAAPADALPVSLDPEEQVADWLWRSGEEMGTTAERLERIGEVDPDWGDWGKFRALSHRYVAQALQNLQSASGKPCDDALG
ncbi:MAG: NUDIX hydrolase [Caldilineaceae bacterium]|nr:NUDIX hydrolase [Caldilineaceae bacterium]